MSLSLLQGYSSPEEAEQDEQYLSSSDEDDGDRHNAADVSETRSFKPLFEPPVPNPSSSSSSSLPSAFDAFSEIGGPPEFLNNCVKDPVSAGLDGEGQQWRHGRRRNRKEKNDLPAGAVMEAKAQLVGIRDRVSNNVDSSLAQASSIQPKGSTATGEVGKRVASAANPSAEDAAELLRMCLQCGVPKTYTNAQGMVCPVCGDRPRAETDKDSKKKGSIIKDREKSKRMKGQSSHSTWKSETEMQLRQQFD